MKFRLRQRNYQVNTLIVRHATWWRTQRDYECPA